MRYDIAECTVMKAGFEYMKTAPKILLIAILFLCLSACNNITTAPVSEIDPVASPSDIADNSDLVSIQDPPAFQDSEDSQGLGADDAAQHHLDKPILMGGGICIMPDGSNKYIYCMLVQGLYIYNKLDLEGRTQYTGTGELWVFDEEQDFWDIRPLYDDGTYPVPNNGYIYIDAPASENCVTVPIGSDEHFTILFDDYNDDGYPDFTLGSWFDSNHYRYKLYTLNDAGEVSLLPIQQPGMEFPDEIFSNVPKGNSIKLFKTGNTSFSVSVFRPGGANTVPEEIMLEFQDNEQLFTQHFEIQYEWKEGAFHYVQELPVSVTNMQRYAGN